MELLKAITYFKLNLGVQGFNLVFIPCVTYGIAELLKLIESSTFNDRLLDGLTIATCMPTTVSMCIMLVDQSGGNSPGAIFNAASGNVLGVFLTPLLIFWFIGLKGDVEIGTVLLKLMLKVLAPLTVGQLIQYFIPGARDWFIDKNNNGMALQSRSNFGSDLCAFGCAKGARKKKFMRVREICLVWIVFTTFSETFKTVWQAVQCRCADLI